MHSHAGSACLPALPGARRRRPPRRGFAPATAPPPGQRQAGSAPGQPDAARSAVPARLKCSRRTRSAARDVPQPLFRTDPCSGPYKPKGSRKIGPAGGHTQTGCRAPRVRAGAGVHTGVEGVGRRGMRRCAGGSGSADGGPDPASQACLPIFGGGAGPGRRASVRRRRSLPAARLLTSRPGAACAGPATQPSSQQRTPAEGRVSAPIIAARDRRCEAGRETSIIARVKPATRERRG